MRENDPLRFAEGKEEIKSRSCYSATLKIRGGARSTETATKPERGRWYNGS